MNKPTKSLQRTLQCHTPRPWRAAAYEVGPLRDEDVEYTHLHYTVAGADGSIIADVPAAYGTDEPERGRANALLITAAPELLEACRAALDFVEASGVTEISAHDGVLQNLLREAITRAEATTR